MDDAFAALKKFERNISVTNDKVNYNENTLLNVQHVATEKVLIDQKEVLATLDRLTTDYLEQNKELLAYVHQKDDHPAQIHALDNKISKTILMFE
jgi:hypothetical protein